VTNSLYAPWVDTCLDMQIGQMFPTVRPVRNGKARDGSNPKESSGISKINLGAGKYNQSTQGRQRDLRVCAATEEVALSSREPQKAIFTAA